MSRFSFKSERCGNGCSTVYRGPDEARTRPRGRAALGRVCYRDGKPRAEQWGAAIAPEPGVPPAEGSGKTRDEAVAAALQTYSPVEPEPELWRVVEVEEFTSIPRRTLRGWIERGHLRVTEIRNGVHFVRCSDVRRAARSVRVPEHEHLAERCP